MTTFSPRSGGSGKPWPELLKDKYNISFKAMRSPFDKVTAQRPDVESGSNVPVSYGLNDDCYDTNTAKWTSSHGAHCSALPLWTAVPCLNSAANHRRTLQLKSRREAGLPAKLGTHGNRARINALFGDGRVETFALQRLFPNSE
jgi:prepilin-type processing-associated H-X9-DG protein